MDVIRYVKRWNKFKELILILNASLREIEDRWSQVGQHDGRRKSLSRSMAYKNAFDAGASSAMRMNESSGSRRQPPPQTPPGNGKPHPRSANLP